MRTIKLKDKEVNVIDSWDDLTIEKYVDLVDLYSNLQELGEELFLLKFIVLLSDLDEEFIGSLYEEDLLVFTELIESFKNNEFKKRESKVFEIDGKLYSYNQVNKLTLGENISIKLLEKESKSKFETWLNLLAILVRPAKEITNEFSEKEYEVEKFVGDINIIKKRKELVKKIPATCGMWILEGFIPGNA